VVIIRRKKCISCGTLILKSGIYDPYICRYCENPAGIEARERYTYLDEF